MYKPSFKTKRNGVPVLSKEEIDNIAENYLLDFCPEAMKTPQEIDIDSFALNYLKLNQDFQYLSHKGIYLGMMVFKDTKKVPVFIPERNEADYIEAKARTIIIDNTLLDENQEHRYRYTMGHECGHDIYHKYYYVKELPNQISLFEEIDEPLIRCRVVNNFKKDKRLWTDSDWMEWQSNYMSSALLMPKSMVIKAVKDTNFKGKKILTDYIKVGTISKIFNVSIEAATYRLEGLGIIDKDIVDIHNYTEAFVNLCS